MTDCSHPSPAAIAQTKTQIIQTVKDLQQEGHLPAGYSVGFINNYRNLASISETRKEILSDPIALSCLNAQEGKAVMLHEAGHIQNGTGLRDIAMTALQSTLFVEAIFILALGSSVLSKKKIPLKVRPLIALALLTAHTLGGRYNAELSQRNELAADAYAVRHSETPASLSGAYQKMAVYRTRFKGPQAQTTYKEQGSFANLFYRTIKIVSYGVWGKNHTHPDFSLRIERIQKLEQKLAGKNTPPAPKAAPLQQPS